MAERGSPLAKALAKRDAGERPAARRPPAEIRFYLDPDTGLPHIYGHGVTEADVERVLRGPGEDGPSSGGSRQAVGPAGGGRYLRVVYVPDAILLHRGSASFETHQLDREEEHRRDAEQMQRRWGAALLDDPMHNPNLALDSSNPSRLASPPRAPYPWRRGGRLPELR